MYPRAVCITPESPFHAFSLLPGVPLPSITVTPPSLNPRDRQQLGVFRMWVSAAAFLYLLSRRKNSRLRLILSAGAPILSHNPWCHERTFSLTPQKEITDLPRSGNRGSRVPFSLGMCFLLPFSTVFCFLRKVYSGIFFSAASPSPFFFSQ